MSLRIIDVPDGADPDGQDLWASMDTANVTTLCDNSIPWETGRIYDFEVRFGNSQVGVAIREDGRLLQSWNVADATFPSGQFGLYLSSQQSSRFGPLTVVDATGVDGDGDGVADANDNCLDVANPDQADSDGDQIGNQCDADIAEPNDCLVNFADLGVLKDAFFSQPTSGNWNPDADFNGDSLVNFSDLGIMKTLFFGAPGPSGLPHGCGCL